MRRHLQGEITVGLYAINPATQRSKWVAIDADYEGAMEDLLKLQYHLAQDEVDAALEMSKRGGHLWIFMAAPALARECRIYIYSLALKLGMRIKGNGLAEGIEILPKHDELRPGEFGNAIRGPLGVHRGADRRYWFYCADYAVDKQIAHKEELWMHMHQPLAKVGKWLRSVVQGYFNYHAVPGNLASLRSFRLEVSKRWLRVIQRRSHKSRITWQHVVGFAAQWLPLPKIFHLYPTLRFAAKHPR